MSKARPNNSTALNIQGLYGIGRIVLCILMLMGIAWFGAVVFRKVDYETAGQFLLDRSFIFRYIPYRQFWATALSLQALPFYLAPLGALFAVFLGAAYYVKDIFALPNLSDALHYILSSMTAFKYPTMVIEAGEKQVVKGKTNLLDAIGGPGLVTIQPGNVVMFRRLREPSNITLRETYFLEPFETIGQIANLDDQHDDRDGVTALTRDGIKITIKDIHFRYRIFPEIRHGRPIRRTLDDPYPFDEKALWNMAYNLVVDEYGLESWRKAVGRVITGGITDFLNFHEVDYVTAPRENQQDPRRELRNNLFFGPTRFGLRNNGAELIWADIGHFSIDNDMVDTVRTDLWAAEWLGRAQVIKALSAEKRMILQDQGQAEAQAELIASIAEALRTVDPTRDPAVNLRRILLVRTAQILDTMKKKLESGTP
jgi:hypothetical protein